MPFKITHTSSHPDYADFGIWIDEKKDSAAAAGNSAEVAKIEAALAAKQNANVAIAPATSADVATEGNNTVNTVIRNELSIAVPEFDEYWNQWRDTFNVQTVVEEI